MPRRHGGARPQSRWPITHDCAGQRALASIGDSALIAAGATGPRLPTHLRNAWVDASQVRIR